jgi:hypothetical protein
MAAAVPKRVLRDQKAAVLAENRRLHYTNVKKVWF